MDGKLLTVGERYLFRLNGKQVPVVYEGQVTQAPLGSPLYEPHHQFRRLDTQAQFLRKSARALSRHYDDCALKPIFPADCSCKARLAAEVGRG